MKKLNSEGEIVHKSLTTVLSTHTSHSAGFKKILLTKDECQSSVTQVAVAYFKRQDQVEEHSHPSMEEFFYCLKGSVEFSIENSIYILKEYEFLKIPVGKKHSLLALSDSELIYWGSHCK